MQSNLLERMNAQNLQSSEEASGQFQILVQDGYQQVCRHSYQNLRFHCVEARPIIVLDAQTAGLHFSARRDSPWSLRKRLIETRILFGIRIISDGWASRFYVD
jgi:hypothetical protein